MEFKRKGKELSIWLQGKPLDLKQKDQFLFSWLFSNEIPLTKNPVIKNSYKLRLLYTSLFIKEI